MSDEIIKVLDALCDKFGIVIDWTKQNILPEVEKLFEKMSTYLLVKDSVCLILSVLGILLVVLCFKYKHKDIINGFDDDGIMFGVSFVICILLIVLLIASIIGLFINGSNLIQSSTIPELRILEYLQDLLSE